jgi:D-alanyl-D-alanine carboxypeptidase
LGLAAIVAALSVTNDAADARHRRVHVHFAHHSARVHHHVREHAREHAHAESYSPPFASIVVDGNSGELLQSSNPDAMRHPASLTKIMTLYLLFERLDAGKIKLDTPLKISAHAAEQAPSKLELKPGQTIAVEDAIKAVVTKSANDVAVAIAENLADDEESFARLMTQKARALGMSHTTYVNASGLPDDEQITSARDQALLGRAIEDRFPRYYRYFSTHSFTYHGEAMRNHNHLLGAVDGVDGIKTGYTRASGFNLVTSVHRDGHYIVAVVLGGHSAFARDAHMRELISGHIKEASLRRTAPVVAERTDQAVAALPPPKAQPAAPPAPRAEAVATATANPKAKAAAAANDPIQPLLVRTISYRTAPVQTASLTPMPTLVPVAARPAPPAAAPAARSQPAAQSQTPPADTAASTASSKSEPTKSESAKIEAAKIEAAKIESSKTEPTKPEPAKAEPKKAELASAEPPKPEPVPPQSHARGGWLIQIGAFEAVDEARQHLSAAQVKARSALSAADPFTERVQKGDKALFRARFAGFDKATAEATCKQLKRNEIECMALKN